MIDPLELRTWLLAAMEAEQVDDWDEDAAGDIHRGRIDAYVHVGVRFEALKSDEHDVRRLLPPS